MKSSCVTEDVREVFWWGYVNFNWCPEAARSLLYMSYILYVPGRETVRPECFKSGKGERIWWEKEDHAKWSSGLGVEFFPVWNRSQSDVLSSVFSQDCRGDNTRGWTEHAHGCCSQTATCFFSSTVLVVGCPLWRVDMIALFERMAIWTDDLMMRLGSHESIILFFQIFGR